jgi:Salmonella virulence plasmid 65kDa B protein
MDLLAERASRGAWRIIPAIAGALSLLTTSVGLAERTHAAELVGATAGELGVSAEGSANYSIEIAVPPGTTGVQPKLSLNYDSQAGNGALGVGFSLGGLSSISRCGKTLPIDSTISAVDYSANDRFCLDGQRLVPVSGSYGADGTEYPERSKLRKKQPIYDSAPQLNYEVFVKGSFEDQLKEYLRGIALSAPHLVGLGATPEQVEDFKRILESAVERIIVEQPDQTRH